MTTTNTENSYSSYQQMLMTVNQALSDLEALCEQVRMTEQQEELQRIQQKLSSHTFSVGIMGEFKRGKSTVINSLLEKEIMPADILPCSATMNRVTYDLHPHAELIMRDGSKKDIPVEQLVSFVTKLTAENESNAAQVDEAIVYYPCRFCKNGVDIIDTPGLNDDERMNKIAEEVIPKLDAVIMVITPDNPFSMSEAEFVRNKLMASDLGRLIFVVNKIDTIRRKSDRIRVVEGIREKIYSSVVQKMADVYGEGSAEYEEAIQKMGKIKVFPFSALDALEGKMVNDQEMIEESGTLELEAALTKMLVEDRGALELSYPLNAIARIAVEVSKTITLRSESLKMSAAEFEESQKKALAEISAIRESKKEERQRLGAKEKEANNELRQMLYQFYPKMEKALKDKLDDEIKELDVKSLAKERVLKETTAKLQAVITSESENQLSLICEQVQNRLSTIIGREIVETGKFVSDATAKIDTANKGFKKGMGLGAEVLATGIEAFISSSFMGIGGIVAGFQNAGVKGAMLGGGISVAVTCAIQALAVSAFAVAGPAVWLVAAVGGTLAGKFSTKALFRKDIGDKKKEELREIFNKTINEIVTELKLERGLEKWCEELTNKRYQAVIDGMENEIDRLLESTETTIDEIKKDLTENEVQRNQLEKKYETILITLKDLLENKVAPIKKRVEETLENY